jgi:argininosuccinate lyase
MFLGVGSRLSEAHTNLLASQIYESEIQSFINHEKYFAIGDAAHVLNLLQIEAIPSVAAKKALKFFQSEIFSPIKSIPLKNYAGVHGDFFTNRLKWLSLQENLGETARLLNIGRPRRESTNIALFLYCRDILLNQMEDILLVIDAILGFSQKYKHIFMTDFTYLIHTQPTNVAHFFSSIIPSLVRQISLLQTIYAQINSSPAASGSTNGTVIGLDRQYAAKLLNFDSILPHTKDATWPTDIFLNLSYVMTSTSLLLKNFCDNLLVFCNDGFNFLSCADKHSRISVIMPHKKNPYQLSMIRGEFRDLSSHSNLFSEACGSSSGYPDIRHPFYKNYLHDAGSFSSACLMLVDVVAHLSVNINSFNDILSSPSIYTADLSQHLSKQYSLPERDLHALISQAVTDSSANDLKPSISEFALHLSASLRSTFNLPIEPKLIISWMAPEFILNKRTESGSASPYATNQLIESLSNDHHNLHEWLRRERGILDYHFLASEIQAAIDDEY